MTNTELRETFKKNLRRLLYAKDITQKDFAKAVGVSAPTVNEWLKGKKMPRMDKIDTICNVLMASRSDLMDEYEPSAPPEPQKSIEASPAPKEDREHRHLQNLLSDPHLRRILESSGQLNESSLQEVQNFIDFQLGKKKQRFLLYENVRKIYCISRMIRV